MVRGINIAIDNLSSGVITKLKDAYIKHVGLNLVAWIKDTAIHEGKSGYGKFSDYSKPYKKIREKAGKQTSIKSFLFSGEMWKMFGIKEVVETGTGFKVIYGGKNEDSKSKISYGTDYEGFSIIQPTKESIEKIEAWTVKEITKIITQ